MGPSKDWFKQLSVVPLLNQPLVNKSLVWVRWDLTCIPLLHQPTPLLRASAHSQKDRATLSVCLLFGRSKKLSIWDDARWGESWAGSAHLQIPRRAWPPYVWKEVRIAGHLVNVDAVLLPVCQAASYESLQKEKMRFNEAKIHFHFISSLTYFGFITGNRLDWELDICSFQDGVLLQNVLLRLIVAKRLKRE